MPKIFEVPLDGKTPEMLISKAKGMISEIGGTFAGDETLGRFSGQGAEGKYTVVGRTVRITVTKKPFIAPWSMVESKIKSFFS